MVDSPIRFDALDLLGIERLSAELIRSLPCPQVVGLTGTLGAGKTTFVQGLARAAGIDVGDVTSPTFTLLQTHHGSVVLNHLDAYRLADEEEFLQLGVEELYEQPDSWTVVEWADRVQGVLPDETFWVELIHGSRTDNRDVVIQTNQADVRSVLQQIQSTF